MKFVKTLLLTSLATASSLLVLGSQVHAAETYTVQAGDTLSAISIKFVGNNSLINQIVQDNHLENQNFIYVGEQLTIDTSVQTTAPAPVTAATNQSSYQASTATPATAASVSETSTTPAASTATQSTPASQTPTNQTTSQPSQTQPVTQNTQATTTAQTATQATATPTTNNSQVTTAANSTSQTTTGTNAAKEWIAQHESGGSYTATNGQYIGRYQLSASYLNGDYSEANQEKVADQYVASRYGSWEAAQSFWQANGWY
ncbi:LysM peptidoglycan-binding domain-containing protein [Enterococcus sp. CSURQ0835]|uniref:aggregation-promoting factor n=1 Tax=Enterococcus sp. CSURQ0835 TaxID=2681394 RepID=UPI0013577340|nr:LysM peptidoglycan-binding domain-containing protein [Enterococcus sp. CSURQ0835]